MNTPVALVFFNRPETTRAVMEAVRAARPPKLFLIQNAPKNDKERVGHQETRAVAEAVDWPCEVYTNYAAEPLSIRERLSSGISWVFNQVERAIILEHDCVPHASFFPYCEELLEKYKDDERIMHIAGTNFHQHDSSFVCKESYYYSVVPLVWGFATWARAWKHYDADMTRWPEVKQSGLLKEIFKDPAVLERWEYRFEQYYTGEAWSWDGQWAFACFINRGLSITPCVNLVSNIGFGPLALTSKNPQSPFANVPTQEMLFPLVHPTAMTVNAAADAYLFKHVFDVNRTMGQRVRWFFRSRFPAAYAGLKYVLK